MSYPYLDSKLSHADRIADLLHRMTLAEKVGQLCQSPMLEYTQHRLQYLNAIIEGRYGSRILAETAWAGNSPIDTVDPAQLYEIQKAAVEGSRLGIPIIVARDVIYGHKTVLPIPLAQSCSWNPELVEQAYRGVAAEASSIGVHWTFSPMLDIVRDPRWGRVIESSGEDPYLTAQFAKAVVKGFQGDNPAKSGNLIACAKHFVGYGAAEGGRDYDTTEISDNTLHNVYLPPFKAAIDSGVATIMSGFNDLGGTPVSGSKPLLQTWLKQQQQFEGMVVSDWGSITDLAYFKVAKDESYAAKIALEAGVDMAMTHEAYDDHLEQLVESGELSMATIDESVRRVLLTKMKAGLFETPYAGMQEPTDVMRAPEHVRKAKQLADQSMVLLKNNGLLPLAQSGVTIAVLGPHAGSKRAHLGAWCLDGDTADVTSIVEGIQQFNQQNTVLTDSPAFSDEMVDTAHQADIVVLCVGESQRRNGEARNIAELALPPGQEELIKAIGETGKPLVVIQCTGRPIPSPAIEQYADALLYAWQSGTETGNAVASLLFGETSPSGKLTMTVPRSTGQVPIYYARKPIGKMRGFAHYKSYKDMDSHPLYPFGYGLSYTKFKYQNLQLDKKQCTITDSQFVSVEISNIGNFSADEIIQCYISRTPTSTTRPERELKAFKRVSLLPGETKKVTFELTPETLAFFGENQTFSHEKGDVTIWVGGDSNCTLQQSYIVN